METVTLVMCVLSSVVILKTVEGNKKRYDGWVVVTMATRDKKLYFTFKKNHRVHSDFRFIRRELFAK